MARARLPERLADLLTGRRVGLSDLTHHQAPDDCELSSAGRREMQLLARSRSLTGRVA